MKIVYKITDSEKKQRMNGEVSTADLLQWYNLNVLMRYRVQLICVLIGRGGKKSLMSSRPHILQTLQTYTEKLLKQLFTELSVFYWDHLFSLSTWKAEHFILLYVQHLPGFIRKEKLQLIPF